MRIGRFDPSFSGPQYANQDATNMTYAPQSLPMPTFGLGMPPLLANSPMPQQPPMGSPPPMPPVDPLQGLLGQWQGDSQGVEQAMQAYYNQPGPEDVQKGRIGTTEAVIAGALSLGAGAANNRDNTPVLDRVLRQRQDALDDEYQQKVLKAREKHAAQTERLKGELMIQQFKENKSRQAYEDEQRKAEKVEDRQARLQGDPDALVADAYQRYVSGEIDRETFQTFVTALKGRDPFVRAVLDQANADRAKADQAYTEGPKTEKTNAETEFIAGPKTAESKARTSVFESVASLNKVKEGLTEAQTKKIDVFVQEAPARLQSDLAYKAALTEKARRVPSELPAGEKPASVPQQRQAIKDELRLVKASISELQKNFGPGTMVQSALGYAKLEARRQELEGYLSGLNVRVIESSQPKSNTKSKSRPPAMPGSVPKDIKSMKASEAAELLGL